MPRRSVIAYKPFSALPVPWEQLYSNEDIIEAAGGLPEGEIEIEHVIEVVKVKLPRRDALVAELEALARSYRVLSELKKSPTAKQKAAAFKKIEDAGRDWLAALSLPEGRPKKGNLLDHVPIALTMHLSQYVTPRGGHSWEGERRMLAVIEGMYRFNEWAGAARRAAEQHPPTERSKRASGDPALDDWIKGLGHVWKDIFNREIGTSVGGPGSRSAGQPGGPFIRFVRVCLRPVLQDKTPNEEAIRERVRRLFKRKRHKSTSKKT